MQRLQKKCIVVESQVKQLQHEKTFLGFGTGEDEKKKEKFLRFFKQEAKTLRMQITEKVRLDAQGKLATDRARIEEIVLEELAKISLDSNQQYSHIEENSLTKKWI